MACLKIDRMCSTPLQRLSADGDAPRIRLELLGRAVLWNAEGERIALERRAAALLALLAIEGSRSRSDLCAMLWPEVPTAQARNSLRQRLFKLQRAAGTAVVTGLEELRLAEGLAHDLSAIYASLAADPGARVGALLEGLDYDDSTGLAEWVATARERVRREVGQHLAELASGHEKAQRIAQALAYAQRLVDQEPLLEHAHRRVMRLHYLRGDRSAALAAFEQCRQRLQRELGAAPDRETRALAEQIGAADEARVPSVRTSVPPLGVLRPPRLSGREPQRERLAAAIADGATLLLEGEPGIGKTRLLEDAAAGRPDVLLTGAQAGDARVPYALLARIVAVLAERGAGAVPDWARAELARLLPALGPAPAARLDALRMQQAWTATLAAASEAGLRGLLVDDLHHADEASLECLLAPAGPRPLARVFGVRGREMPAALQRWLEAAAAGAVDRLALAMLDEAGVTALLASLELARFEPRRWSRAMTRHSGGNPLFVLETLRALLALGDAAPAPDTDRLPVPAALDALIARRLAQLSEPALRLMRVAALAGADFDADVAARVLETHPVDMVDAWRELEQAQLLRDGRPAHDLIAEAAAQSLPAAIAQSLHSRLAASLDALGRGAARVAPHWAAAQAWPRAGDAYAAAADEARRASRRSDEIVLWERAAEAFDRAGQLGKAFDARAESVPGVILVRGIAAAMPLIERLDADHRTEPQRIRALTGRATTCLMAGQAAAGEAAAREALDIATRLGAQWPRFEAACLLTVALSQSGRADAALQTIEPLRDLVLTQGDAEQRHRFWSDYAYALKAAQRTRDTADALRAAIACAHEVGDYAELATLNSNLALIEGNLGHVPQALAHARSARALGDPLGDALGPASGAVEMYVASHEAALGRYREALGSFARADACFAGDAGTVWLGLAANYKANLLIHLGQFARAQQLLQHDATMIPVSAARRECLLARIDHALGHRGERSIANAIALLGERPDPIQHLLLRLDAARALPPDEGAAACQALHDDASEREHPAIAMRARVLRLDHLLGAQALTDAEVDAAVQGLRVTQPSDTYLPSAWWSIVLAYQALGRIDEADQALRTAWSWVVEGALPQVPDAYRDSFLQRNPTNLALLAAAARRLSLTVPPAPVTPR
ncbi:AAA family ATPase OS=Rhizobacter sp OX=1909292 GN=H7306_07515 PE=4 SV=1 [Rhizobacter fulvus]